MSGRSLPFSCRLLSSVPYLCAFHKDFCPQLSQDNDTPYRKVSAGGREVGSCLRKPLSSLQKRGRQPLGVQRPLGGVGSPWKHWLSLSAEPPGGSNSQSLAATRVPGLPGPRLFSKGVGTLLLSSCLPPPSPRLVLSWARWQHGLSGAGNLLCCGQHGIGAITRDCYTEDVRGRRAIWIQQFLFGNAVRVSVVSAVPINGVQFWRQAQYYWMKMLWR